jgi:hypothetical protein
MNTNTPFKRMLRDIVGGTIASARTETERMRFYREFLTDNRRGSEFENRSFIRKENIQLSDIVVPPEDIAAKIEREKNSGFDPESMEMIRTYFTRWYTKRRSDQGRNAANARFSNEAKKKVARGRKRQK